MRLFATFTIASKALLINKVRTSLTVLGMVIGIASVIIVFSAGEGINGLILGQIESFGGSDMIETEIKVPSTKKGSGSEMQSGSNLAMGVQVTTLSLDDMEDLNKLPNIKGGYAGVMGQELVSFGNEQKKSFLLGVSSSYLEIDKTEIAYGRFFSEAEDDSLDELAVLGYKIKEKLFGDSDPIGKSIKIRKKKFRVIGVIEERGAVMSIDFDDFVYVPIQTLQKKIMGINHVSYMMHQVINTDLIDDTAEEMRYVLRENHDIEQPTEIRESWTDTGKDDFRVVTMIESMDIISVVTDAITWLLLAIVAISLVVGGVGIMNIMYVIVTERTSEIGLRKAVGAKYSDIMMQFLAESVVITIFGAIIGVIVGVAISYLIYWGAGKYGFEWDFYIPTQAYFVSLGFSLFFGLAFGLYPARKAAKLSPIEAIRNE